jgi:hypothetical protein
LSRFCRVSIASIQYTEIVKGLQIVYVPGRARADHMSEERRRYVSYLLRLWQTEHEGALVWRASLQSAYAGERWGFATLDELCAFLEQETAALDEGKPQSPSGPSPRSL